MSRISPVDRDQATGKARELLDTVHAKFGKVPNVAGVLANAPAALEGYLSLSGALGKGSLDAKVREQIAIAIATANSCDYCLAAHTAIAQSLGVSEADLASAQRAEADDAKVAAALQFARRLVETRGFATDDDLAEVRTAGYGDKEILEIVGAVAVNILTNYTNHVAQTDVDFPAVDREASASV